MSNSKARDFLTEVGWWFDYNRTAVIWTAVLIAIVVLGLWACFQPYCTTYSSGDTVCSQVVWGGKVYWRE